MLGVGVRSSAWREEARKERRKDPSVLIAADKERVRTEPAEEGGKHDDTYLSWRRSAGRGLCVGVFVVTCKLMGARL